MQQLNAVHSLSALGHLTRLRIYHLLASADSAGLPAGTIAAELAMPPNALSNHLAIMSRALLVTQERQGRSIVYRANKAHVAELATFLLNA